MTSVDTRKKELIGEFKNAGRECLFSLCISEETVTTRPVMCGMRAACEEVRMGRHGHYVDLGPAQRLAAEVFSELAQD